MSVKYLAFNPENMTVTVYDDEEKIAESQTALGHFFHEDNIDPFSSVKFPVLMQHALTLLRNLTEDKAEKAAINQISIKVEAGYEVAIPEGELNQSENGELQPDGREAPKKKTRGKKAAAEPVLVEGNEQVSGDVQG